jgi:hypothetical protein
MVLFPLFLHILKFLSLGTIVGWGPGPFCLTHAIHPAIEILTQKLDNRYSTSHQLIKVTFSSFERNLFLFFYPNCNISMCCPFCIVSPSKTLYLSTFIKLPIDTYVVENIVRNAILVNGTLKSLEIINAFNQWLWNKLTNSLTALWNTMARFLEPNHICFVRVILSNK